MARLKDTSTSTTQKPANAVNKPKIKVKKLVAPTPPPEALLPTITDLPLSVIPTQNITKTKTETVILSTEKPKRILRVKKSKSIFRMILALLFAVVLIWFPYILGLWNPYDGHIPRFGMDVLNYYNQIPIFNLELLYGLWYIIVFWTLVIIVSEIIKMIMARYTMQYAVTTIITNVIVLISVAIVFLNPNIMNTYFIPSFNAAFNYNVPGLILTLLIYFNWIVYFILCLILISGGISTFNRARRYK